MHINTVNIELQHIKEHFGLQHTAYISGMYPGQSVILMVVAPVCMARADISACVVHFSQCQGEAQGHGTCLNTLGIQSTYLPTFIHLFFSYCLTLILSSF